MKRPQMVNLELEDLKEDFTAIPEYIESLENKVKKLELQLYGVSLGEGVPVKDIPDYMAM